MKNHNNSFTEKLLGQEAMDSKLRTHYQKRVADMMDRKIHWLVRVLLILVTLAGICFSVSLIVHLANPSANEAEVHMIVLCSIVFLLPCVVFYTSLIAIAAVRGKFHIGSTVPVFLGATIIFGFFICLWLFITFVLPIIYEHIQKSLTPENSLIWSIGLACMLLIFILFGVLSAGITFILHLLYGHHSRNYRKLLEIELAIAEMAEKKDGVVSSN